MHTQKLCVLMLAWLFCMTSIHSIDINFTIHHDTDSEKHTTPCVYLFAHGLGANHHQGIHVLGKNDIYPVNYERWIINKPCAVFNFQDVTTSEKLDKTEFLRKKVCLGQDEDIMTLHQAYQQVYQKFPTYNIVLVGISRGASTILNYLAEYEPKNIKAVVIESPFDRFSSIVKHLLQRYCLSWLPFSKDMAYKVFRTYFPNVNPRGVFPAKIVHKVPTDLPIIIVHSKKDKVVPVNSSRNLYIKLKKAGNSNSYLVELASGNHGKLFHGPDADLYYYTVHAFYKKYGLPHNHDAAQRGDWFLTSCQPDIHKLAAMKRSQLEAQSAYFFFEEEDDELDDLFTCSNYPRNNLPEGPIAA